jgi:hypothetical protein
MKLSTSYLFILVVLLTACSGEHQPSNKLFTPQINLSIASLMSNFVVDLPKISATNLCAAVSDAKKACLKLTNSAFQTAMLEGAVTLTPNGANCATAALSADVQNSFLTNPISDARFELLNSQQASCDNTNTVEHGGNSLGVTNLLGTTPLDNGFQEFHLRLLMHNQANAFDLPNLALGRAFHSATLLDSGKVWISGGIDNQGNAMKSTLLISADGMKIENGPDLLCGRYQHTATLIKVGGLNGKVLVAGGLGDCTPSDLAKLEIYDPQTNLISELSLMNKNSQPQTLTPGRYGHQATQVSSKDLLLFTGGRDSISKNLLSPIDASFVIDLNLLTLDKTNAILGSTGDHQTMVVDFGNTFGERPVIWSGIQDDNWKESSYQSKVKVYMNDTDSYYLFNNDDLNGTELRHLSTIIPIALNKWGLVGGRYDTKFSNGNIDQMIVRDDVVRWQYLLGNGGQQVDTLAGLSMLHPRFSVTNISLQSNSTSYTNLTIGGGEIDPSANNQFRASNAVEFLISQSDASINCFKDWHPLVQARYGHSSTLLNNGRIIVFGGFNGAINNNLNQPNFQQSNQVLTDYELLAGLSIPNSCQ